MRGRRRRGFDVRIYWLGERYDEITSVIGDVVAEVTSAVWEGISEAVKATTGFWKRGRVKVESQVEVEEPVVLLVEAGASNVRVRESPPGRVKISGFKVETGEVKLMLEEYEGKRLARLIAEAADIEVEAPMKAVGIVADASNVRVEARARPLEYLSIKSDASGIKVEAPLLPGGGVYASLDVSSAKVYVTPVEEGEYWVDLEADASSFRAEFEGDKVYEVEEENLRRTRLLVERRAEGEPRVRVKVRVKADTSTIRLL
ncbi:MAG: hypothetical protein F7B17_08135 [Desulfurococcales archaeon]|nr:hypothetical protein [Desulfurococcales archaeon]